MLKQLMVAIFAVVLFVSPSLALTVEGVDLPYTMSVGSELLLLNGAGVRAKKIAFVNKNVYVAGLYLKAKSSDAQKIIQADEPMALRIQIISSLITSERFIEATKEGFQESTKGNTAPIQKEIDTFIKVFSDEIKKGDLFEIVYTPGIGIQVFKNDSKTSPVAIKGLPIKTALFGIWLGERTEKNLQILAKQLLGTETAK
ncbi:MAG: chalcone isomerase family protein [Desulfobacteraceae bacterium]|nr:chalcone isomerase family protein [Desulfobacteraceae bacterium]